jgi:hypothetical protein
VDELHRQIQVEQESERFTRHRTRNDVPSDHDLIHARLLNLLEDSFQRRDIRVDII